MELTTVNSYQKETQIKNSRTTKSSKAEDNIKTEEKSETPSTSAVYEKSNTEVTKKVTYKQDMQTIERLKAEADKRNSSLRNLVEKMLVKQGVTFDDAGMYQLLREGKVEVSEEDRLKAVQDISEDGYFGINQTSDRLVSFAKALTGGDPSKADEMIAAVKKGYEEATKAWGGTLPDICSQTINTTIAKLDEWKNSLSTSN